MSSHGNRITYELNQLCNAESEVMIRIHYMDHLVADMIQKVTSEEVSMHLPVVLTSIYAFFILNHVHTESTVKDDLLL